MYLILTKSSKKCIIRKIIKKTIKGVHRIYYITCMVGNNVNLCFIHLRISFLIIMSRCSQQPVLLSKFGLLLTLIFFTHILYSIYLDSSLWFNLINTRVAKRQHSKYLKLERDMICDLGNECTLYMRKNIVFLECSEFYNNVVKGNAVLLFF